MKRKDIMAVMEKYCGKCSNAQCGINMPLSGYKDSKGRRTKDYEIWVTIISECGTIPEDEKIWK